MRPNPFGVIVLAAGVGKRMQSDLPKVLHELAGKPILFHILEKVLNVHPDAAIALVVGHGREAVESAVKAAPFFDPAKITFVVQPEQRGTGDAARVAMDSAWGEALVKAKAAVTVLPGDLPLVTDELVAAIMEPLDRDCALRLLTCELSNPTGYGRVARRGKAGSVQKIVEEKDATLREKEIREVACSIYAFQAAFLKSGLAKLSTKNAQKEFYLTDLIGQAARAKKRIEVLKWAQPEDVRGINDPWELALARQAFKDRCIRAWCLRGVKFIDPSSAWIDCSVEIARDVTIYPGVILLGKTTVGERTVLGPRTLLKDATVGRDVNLKQGTIVEQSRIEEGATLGPYAHLRPESVVGKGAKVGNFVELKKAKIGEKTSVAHLSYVGDAEVGRDCNIGCGFVTCNYDGRMIDGSRKHKTVIEDGVFMGSACQVIAPIRIGKGAYVASGSTLTKDVEADALAVARSRQENKLGYARKLKGDGN